MSIDLGLKLLQMAVLLGSVAVNAFLFFRTRRDRRFAELAEELADHTDSLRLERTDRIAGSNGLGLRLSVLETKIKGMPTHGDLEEIRGDLADIGSNLATVNERSRGTLDAVRRIEQHLLERPR